MTQASQSGAKKAGKRVRARLAIEKIFPPTKFYGMSDKDREALTKTYINDEESKV